MADPMKIRAKVGDGGVADVRVVMIHEMETGQRKDAAGKLVPAWHINEVHCKHNGKAVMNIQWGPSVSKNPYLQFKVKNVAKGDKISVEWIDNRGDKRMDETTAA